MEEEIAGSMWRTRRAKTAVASAALLAVVAAAIVVGLTMGGGTADDDSVAGGPATAQGDAREGGTGGEAGSSPGADATGPVPSLDLTVVASSGEGEYVYDVLTEIDGQEPIRAQRVLTIKRMENAAGEVREDVAYGNGHRDERVLAAEGVVVPVTHFGPSRCEWDSPWVLYQLPLDIGASWDTSADCEMPDEQSNRRASVTETARVVEVRAGRVGNEDVGVVVIERQRVLIVSAELEGGTPLVFRAEDTITEEFAPALGLVVNARMVTKRPATDGGIVEGTETITLTSVRPR